MSSKGGGRKKRPALDSDDEDDDFQEQPKKRKKNQSMIDDAAEESGDEESGEDEDEEDGINDYVEDGFVTKGAVDEDDEGGKQRGVLEDSDDEDGDDDDETPKKKTGGRIRKLNEFSELTEDDRLLIEDHLREQPGTRGAPSSETLREDSFAGDDEDVIEPEQRRTRVAVEQYDDPMEDDMDNFIEDDIGDQEKIRRFQQHATKNEDDVNEQQLNEASEIFGTDYLDFLDDNNGTEDAEADLMNEPKFREPGVGTSFGVDSDDDEVISSEDDEGEDLLGDGADAAQKVEALRLRREKRKLAKEQRVRQAAQKKASKRKAQLRKAFEPVQIIENFCTERDDEIRQTDVPERFYGLNAPFVEDDLSEEAEWIAEHISSLSSESPEDIESISKALQFMHKDKLEPSFIKRYRLDYIPSKAVQENLFEIFDQHIEWNRMLSAREKVEGTLSSITTSADSNESVGETSQKLVELEEELKDAQTKLNDTAKQEALVKAELETVEALLGDDDEDDELFGGDDGDDEDKVKNKNKNEKKRLHSHLATIQSLLEARADKVSTLEANVKAVREQTQALTDPGPMERVSKKTSREKLWNAADYGHYIALLSEVRHLADVSSYLNLIKEGNEAIRKKEIPQISLDMDDKNAKRRSRRYDRDFYRTCVAEGLRNVCYRFLLGPNRVGIKLEATIRRGNFDFSTQMPGEDDGPPTNWVPEIVSSSPSEFCTELINSGELVVMDAEAGSNDPSADPLRGCRYVAAMELSQEPRVRRHLRDIYRRNVQITTVPTRRGLTEIDAFHECYGLHLIRGKPVKLFFPVTEADVQLNTMHMSSEEKSEYRKVMMENESHSCIQYLKILKAKASGDFNSFIHLPLKENHTEWYKDPDSLFTRSNQDTSPLISELEKVYMPTDTDAGEWNSERMAVLEFAMTTFLLPLFEQEVRRDLLEAANKRCVALAGESLKAMAMEGPYRPLAILNSESRFLDPTGDLAMIGVCCGGDAKEATFLASVTTRGESTDYLAVPGGVTIDAYKMREKTITFLLQTRPSVVVVGTSGGFKSRQMQRKLDKLVAEAMNRWNTRAMQGDDEDDEAFEERQTRLRNLQPAGYYDEDDEDWQCNVELVDDSVAQLFGRSVRGKKEFAEYAVNLRCAIATARYAKDPLAELTYTWSVASDMGTFGTEMLFLNVHPLQQLLPKTLLLRQYERILCESVASVGCDINTCCELDHLQGLLMFVPGLGPRKAANLKQALSKLGGAIAKRRDLLDNRMLGLGPVVYNNAVAFLKIRDVDQLTDQFLHPLDETRLHPDVYLRNNWASKIAFDALERNDSRTKESAAIKAITDVMDDSHRVLRSLFDDTKKLYAEKYKLPFSALNWNPRVDIPSDHWSDKVEELDLESFAKIIEGKNNGTGGKWYSHLDMIKWEFRLPFADPRFPMQPLSGDKFFYLITGESDLSLRPGKEVSGKVIENGDYGSRVKLEGDIPAFIPLRNMSDNRAESADEYVSVGQTVTAVVTAVKQDHMSVDMSLKESDFRKRLSSWPRPESLGKLDLYFDGSAANKIEEDNAQQRDIHIENVQRSIGVKSGETDILSRKGRVCVDRACTHPNFVNKRNDEVDRMLKERNDIGEALIRPSSKSCDSLTMHWLVRENCIRLTEIVEEEKETDTSIGKVLKVKGEKYGSIEELLVRYISPMNEFVEELENHRKFLDAEEKEVDSKLSAQKEENPSAIPYALSWMEAHPGYAVLRFISRTTVRRHLISITPKGFSWENNVYPSAELLINAFKKNPGGPRAHKSSARAPKANSEPEKASNGRGRWGEKPPAAPPVRPPPPPSRPVHAGAPPAPPPRFRIPPPPVVPVTGGPNQWGQARPPPPNLPPPPAYAQQGPPNLPPPPRGGPPLPPAHKPPPPFNNGPGETGQGRGRGRTLPAWMSNG